MRSLILTLVLGCALRGQAPATPEPGKPDALAQFKNQLEQLAKQKQAPGNGNMFLTPEESRKYFSNLKSVPSPAAPEQPKEPAGLKPGQPCAIPLLNALRRENVDPKMILPAGPLVDGKIRIVAPPAPSCDDVK